MVAQLDKKYLNLSKEKTSKRFLSYLFFEGRPHSTKGQWFNPVVFFILKGLLKIRPNKPVEKPVFIVGLGRSGTTVLGLIMSMHKDLAYLNEPKAIWSLIDERIDTVDDYLIGKGRLDLTENDVTESIVSKAKTIFANYLRIIGRSRLLDKFPEHVFRIDYLLSIFPDAKIIFISRSGNDAVASIAKWSQIHQRGEDENLEDWWGRADAKWSYICAQLLSSDDYQKALAGIDLASIDHLNRAALEWVLTMNKGLQVIQSHGDKICHVRYEELLDNPDQFLQAVFEYCELNEDSQVTEYAQSKIYKQTPKPSPELLEPIRLLLKRLACVCKMRLAEVVSHEPKENFNIRYSRYSGRAWWL